MLKLIGNDIRDADGHFLKTLSCPKNASQDDLVEPRMRASECIYCDRIVVNTDFLSEAEIVSLLKSKPETCLQINRLNPVFSIE